MFALLNAANKTISDTSQGNTLSATFDVLSINAPYDDMEK